MPIDTDTTVDISTRGDIDRDLIDRVQSQVERVTNHCREPVQHIEIRLIHEPSHRDAVRAETTLTVKHGPVRAHAVAASAPEAVDAMVGRLRSRLRRFESKLHRIGTKRHGGTATTGSWHHGDVATAPRRPLPLAGGDADVVRRKSFAGAPMSVIEAMTDLELLDHDFYLFEHDGDLGVCVLSRNPDGSFALASDQNRSEPLDIPGDVTVYDAPGACVLDDAGAQRLLDSTDDPFVFYRSATNKPAQVLYRRFDGNFGTIELD